MAALAGRRRRDARGAGPRDHPRDGGRRLQDHATAGPDRGGREVSRHHPLSQFARAAWAPVDAPPTEPPDGRQQRHCGERPRRSAARVRGRRHRHQPGDRQRGRVHPHDAPSRRHPAASRHSDPDLRAGTCDHRARGDRAGRAGRPRLSVHRRHREGQRRVRRHRSRSCGRRATPPSRCGAVRSATT